MALPTSTKMRIARALNRAIVGSRALLGLNSIVHARRRQVSWCLDLNEGIDLALYLGVYQAVPKRVIARWVQPGSLVIDIGANIGSHCLPMARQVGPRGRVVAIEPTDYAFSKLVANTKLNATLADRIIPIQAALGDETTHGGRDATFYSRWPLRGATAHRHAGHMGQLESAGGARFSTLDGLLNEIRVDGRVRGPVGFVKLDVDGNELRVLRGGERTFGQERPPMLIEIAPHVQDEVVQRLESLLRILQNFGYRLENADTAEPIPMSAEALRGIVKPGASIDAIARPA